MNLEMQEDMIKPTTLLLPDSAGVFLDVGFLEVQHHSQK
jgi:hypothetical protein